MLDKPSLGSALAAATTIPLSYQSGFLGTHETEALEGALPIGRNSPQRAPYGLYAEQLSGTAFTAPRATNRRTWFYRIRPSALHASGFRAVDGGFVRTAPCHDESDLPIGQLRWNPIPIPDQPLDFLDGLRTIATCGDASLQLGMASHVYLATRSMEHRYFYNADGELLIVPQLNGLRLRTECGVIEITPGDICVVTRGLKSAVDLLDGPARGYICENYGTYFHRPALRQIEIGAVVLADIA